MKSTALVTTLFSFLLLAPLAAAQIPIDASQIRDAASALDANAECAQRLAQNITLVEQGARFSCRTDCVSIAGEPATCSTTSGSPFDIASAIASPSPLADRGPLGFQLWIPASDRGGGFDAAPFLSAFDPFGSFG